MYEVRWHGIGGQGAVTAAELLADAAIYEGLYAQAFPFFGPERRGAPVLAFTRIDSAPIEIVSQVYEPDAVVILEPGLARTIGVAEGLKLGGVVVLNSPRGAEEFKNGLGGRRLAVVDAAAVAQLELGLGIVNTAMLGAAVKATSVVGLESAVKVVQERFGASNAEATREAYLRTVMVEGDSVR